MILKQILISWLQSLDSEYEVSVAMDGESALEAIDADLPDLILLDIMMPGMDGYEVCRRLKSKPETSLHSNSIYYGNERDRE